MRRNEYHHTGQQLKDDFAKFKQSPQFKTLEAWSDGSVPDKFINALFTAGWWAGRVAQLNHRPIKQSV